MMPYLSCKKIENDVYNFPTWQYCKYKDIFDSRIIINSTAKFYISISYQKDLLSIDTRIFTPSFFGLIIKTNVAYLHLSDFLFYPVFFYNINNIIIFNIFRQVRHNGFRCFNCKTLSKYRNFFYYFDTLIIYGMFYRFGLIDVPDEIKENMRKNDRSNNKQKKHQKI